MSASEKPHSAPSLTADTEAASTAVIDDSVFSGPAGILTSDRRHLSGTYIASNEHLPDNEAVSREVVSPPIRSDLAHAEQMPVISVVNDERAL